jgi:hypothetical protein
MWEYQSEDIKKDQIVKYTLTEGGTPLTSAQVIGLLNSSQVFRRFFNTILVKSAFEAFFWETPAISTLTINNAFEFVLVKSDSLSRTRPNTTPFQKYFADNREVVHFSNLGGDAYLIVPCRLAAKECYAHLAAFVREAPATQIDTFWQNVGEQCARKLTNKPLWLSTAGLGVSWLHLRIDSIPKYYRYSKYKMINKSL